MAVYTPENCRHPDKFTDLLLGLVVKHALDDLLLLDEERPDDALAHATPTPGTAVSTGNVLLALGGDRIPELGRAESLHAAELVAAVTALGHGGLLGDIEDVEPGGEKDAGARDQERRERNGMEEGGDSEEAKGRRGGSEVSTPRSEQKRGETA